MTFRREDTPTIPAAQVPAELRACDTEQARRLTSPLVLSTRMIEGDGEGYATTEALVADWLLAGEYIEIAATGGRCEYTGRVWEAVDPQIPEQLVVEGRVHDPKPAPFLVEARDPDWGWAILGELVEQQSRPVENGVRVVRALYSLTVGEKPADEPTDPADILADLAYDDAFDEALEHGSF